MKRQNTKEREIAEEGFWRNPAILWLRRGRLGGRQGGKHETNYSGKDGKTAKSSMRMKT